MSSIRETVTEAMKDSGLGDYVNRAAVVIEALEEREWAIADALVTYAAGYGLPPDQSREALAVRGLESRPARVLTSVSETSPLSEGERDELGSIRHDLSGLMERIDKVLG
jgi:hypothetical protein